MLEDKSFYVANLCRHYIDVHSVEFIVVLEKVFPSPTKASLTKSVVIKVNYEKAKKKLQLS